MPLLQPLQQALLMEFMVARRLKKGARWHPFLIALGAWIRRLIPLSIIWHLCVHSDHADCTILCLHTVQPNLGPFFARRGRSRICFQSFQEVLVRYVTRIRLLSLILKLMLVLIVVGPRQQPLLEPVWDQKSGAPPLDPQGPQVECYDEEGRGAESPLRPLP